MNFKGCQFNILRRGCLPIGLGKLNEKSLNKIRCWKNSNVYSDFVSNVGVLHRVECSLSNALFRVFIRVVMLSEYDGNVDNIDSSLD